MKDLTTGSVTRHLLQTSGFMLVTMVFQTLYFLVDLYWVGRLGKEAVAGVGVAGNLMFIVLAVTQMLAVGTTTLISHAAGRKDHDHARLVFNQSQVLSALVGALFLVVGLAIRAPYVAVLSADPATARLAADYMAWYVPASALQFPMIGMASALRGTGQFMPGMIVQSATVVLNMILAPVFVFGWGTGRPMGVAGAALATFVAIAVGTLWLLTYFRPRDAYLRYVRADWAPRVGLWGAMLKIGLPAGAEFALLAVYLFTVYTVARPFGAAAQAGFGIGMRVLQAGFMPIVALGFSLAPVAGQNVGARLPRRVREAYRSAALMAVTGMALFAIVCQIAPGAMIRAFSSDPHVVAVGEEYLRIVSWSLLASGPVFVNSSMFQALGNTVPSLLSSLVRIVAVVVPAIVLSHLPGFQLRWIWWCAVGSIAIQLAISSLFLRREMARKLPHDEALEAAVHPQPSAPASS